MQEEYKLAIIGIGAWGKKIVATCNSMPNISLECVASRNLNLDRSLLPTTCKIFNDWHSMLSKMSRQLQGVIIATPPALHVPMAIEAIKSNLSVMVEKPLSLNIKEAYNLLEVASSRKIFVLVNHIHLFHPALIKLKEMLPEVGKIESLDIISGNYGPFRKDANVLWDWGPHDLAICLYLMNEKPYELSSYLSSGSYTAGTIQLRAKFPKCDSVNINLSNILDQKIKKVSVKGANGKLCYNGLNYPHLTYINYNKSKNTETIDVDATSALEKAIQTFTNNINEQPCDLKSLRLGVEVVELLHKVEQQQENYMEQKCYEK